MAAPNNTRTISTDDPAVLAVAEEIAAKMTERLAPLVDMVESLIETNEHLLDRVEQLEGMLGLTDNERCTCPKCRGAANLQN